MKKYIIPFVNDNGARMEVRIYDTQNASSTETITLRGSASPFAVKMPQNNDVYTPIRHTTATINVLHRLGEQLELTNNLRYYVELDNISDSTIIWRGFIRAEAYTQEYSSNLTPFSYNCTDIIGTAESIKMDGFFAMSMTGAMQAAFVRIPWNYIDKTSHTGSVWCGNSLPTKPGDTSYSTLSLGSRAEHWSSYDAELAELTTSSALDVLREFATLYGVTIYSNGVDVYIGSTDDNQMQLCGVIPRLGTHGTWEADQPLQPINSDTFGAFAACGSHDINISQPAQRVSMTYGGKAYGDSTFPSIDKEHCKVAFIDNTAAVGTQGQTFPWFVVYEQGDQVKGLQFFRRAIGNNGYAYSTIEPTINNWKTCAAGAAFIRQDYWNTREEEDGADKGSNSDGLKRNYNLTDTLVIWGYDKTTGRRISTIGQSASEYTDRDTAQSVAELWLQQRLTPPLVMMTSPTPVAYSSRGGLCISFSAILDSDIFPLKHNRYAQKGYYMDLQCSLRIGNHFWNGERWTEINSRFGVRFRCSDNKWTNGVDCDNTKQLNENYTCDGYSIPFNGMSLTGQMELCIYGVARADVEESIRTEGGQLTTFYKPILVGADCTQIFNFSIKFCEAYDYEYKDGFADSTRTLTRTNNGGSGDTSVTTSLCSGRDVKDNDGVIIGTEAMHVPATLEEGATEQLAFSRLIRHATTATERLTITISSPLVYLPTSEYTNNGKTYRVETCDEYDPIRGVAKITLIRTDNIPTL